MQSAVGGAPIWTDRSPSPVLDAAACVAHVPSAAFAVDAAGCIVAANEAMARLLGRDAAQLVGMEVAALAVIDGVSLRNFFRKNEASAAEFRFRAADGGERQLALSVGPNTLNDGRVVSVADMTSSRLAEKSLREERDRYLDMIRAASDWFFESDGTNRSDGTRQVKIRLIRTGSEGTVKRYEVQANWPDDTVDPSYDPEGLAALIKKCNAGEPYRDFVHRQRRSDGMERYYRAGGVPYRNNGVLVGYRGVAIDVTAQVFAERALRRAQRHLEHAQRVAAIGSTERDLATGAEEWSEQIYRILGIDRASFERTDENVLALIHREDRARVSASFARARAGLPTPPAEYRVVRPDGEIRVIYAETDVERDASGTPIRLLTVFKDVTELRMAEQRQREHLQHSQKLETLGTLASGVAHDLNNTLVPILALAKMVAKRLPDSSRDRQNLTTIIQAGERARDLVKQILAFSRKEAATRERIDLAELGREALRMLRASVPSTIRIEQNIVAVPALFADAGQLHQVVTNLVTNAAHAIGDKIGAITVAIAPAPGTQISQATEQPCVSAVRLSVSDTGCGIDSATLARIFEPFFTTKAVGEGTGLGLSMVQGIVTQHGGILTVESTPGEGTRFDIYLPALAAETSELPV